MLFNTFKSQKERKEFGGSSFIEVQFCKLPKESTIERIVSVESIILWQKDSLYISDEYLFDKEYSFAFDCGIYNNLKTGTMNLDGINYYSPCYIDCIIKIINKKSL